MSGKPEVTIYIGGVHAARQPTLIKTLLGSCIAVGLVDPAVRIGGLNHFMLPHALKGNGGGDLARFGAHAMELLIGEMHKLGADRRRLVAKAVGGGHVLRIAAGTNTVPEQNIRFIRGFLETEGNPVLAQDLGGHLPRLVLFHTDTGRALVRKLSPRALTQVQFEEREHAREAAEVATRYGEVELFGD